MKVSYLGMAGYDGPAPGLEFWPAPASFCDPAIAARSMRQTLDACARADMQGYDWVSVSEHHYAPYIMTPNPCVMAGALSQVVKRAKIALLGPLVPLVNPVRLAEELAMLDVLTEGRLVVLFLRGTPNEHMTYGTPPEQTRGMTQEGIDLVLKAWTDRAPFAWSGEHYEFGTVSVWPRPIQQPHPPVYGSGNSEESVMFAARRGMGIAFSFAPPEIVRRWVDLYRAEAAKAGWAPTGDHVVYRGIAYPAASDGQAMDDMGGFFDEKVAEQAQFKQLALGGPPVVPLVSEPFFVGGPETLIGRFETLRDCGVGVVDLAYGIGTHAQQMVAMDLFAERVLPAVRAL
jgi:alkanesulfonate monooxygenase SsuD/methylene tetrahydromethanopterin reductase-like flavin-dependent oxidoreductase (luciferase family)